LPIRTFGQAQDSAPGRGFASFASFASFANAAG
jgi:hypothetical protein